VRTKASPGAPRGENLPTTRVGIAVTTIGRWAYLEELLASIWTSTYQPVGIVVANQSGGRPPEGLQGSRNVLFVDSTGGASQGRNDAAALLRDNADVIAFPNDHSRYRADTVEVAARFFDADADLAGLAGTLLEPTGARFKLPPSGSALDRRTVWRAIESTLFVRSGFAWFRPGLGPGSRSPWQAGEGTDLLLGMISEGRRVIAAPEVVVLSPGERRSLSDPEWQTKLRSYARGTGYVLRLHHAGLIESLLFVLKPPIRLLIPPSTGRPTVRECIATVVGRLEGRLGRCFSAPDRLDQDALRK
jgi:hypothetical protein